MSSDNDNFVKNMLLESLPSSDTNKIEKELKRSFIFGKHRSKDCVSKKQIKQKKNLNRKQRKAIGLFSVPKQSIKYRDIEPMHILWKEYMRKQLDISSHSSIPSVVDKSWEPFSLSLVKADYHGALITIVRSRCPSLVGKKGICIIDTKNCFQIVSQDDVTRTIPKESSVFRIHLDQIEFTVFGKNIMIRPAERSVKKIKQHMEADL